MDRTLLVDGKPLTTGNTVSEHLVFPRAVILFELVLKHLDRRFVNADADTIGLTRIERPEGNSVEHNVDAIALRIGKLIGYKGRGLFGVAKHDYLSIIAYTTNHLNTRIANTTIKVNDTTSRRLQVSEWSQCHGLFSCARSIGHRGLHVILTGIGKASRERHHTVPLAIELLVVAKVQGIDAVIGKLHLAGSPVCFGILALSR